MVCLLLVVVAERTDEISAITALVDGPDSLFKNAAGSIGELVVESIL